MEHIAELEPPRPLDAEIAAIWRRATAYLKNLGVLGQVAPDMLVRYCEHMADWYKVSPDRSLEGAMIRVKLSPVLSRLECALGLTPADRRGVMAAPAPVADPIADLLKGNG